MRTTSTISPARVGWAIVGVVVGAVLLTWGVASCQSGGPTGTNANPAFDGPMSTSSAASVRSSDLRAAFDGDPIPLRYEVLARVPADRDSFTQGLEFTPDGRLFESTGRYGESALRQIDPTTGATIDEVLVDPTWWAEGITLVTNDGTPEMAMLTWREGIVAFYDPDTLTERRRASYDGEGWGLCQLDDGTLVMSNGSSDLTRRDPVTFDVIGRVTVTRAATALANINELECVDGLVWANIWQTERIVVIDPGTGDVVAELDVSGMLDRKANPGADVLNGIALVPGTTDEFWIAGKLWPSTWVVRVQPA